MSDPQRQDFAKRLKQLDRNTRKVARRKARARVAMRLPVTTLALALALGLAVKTLVIANVSGGYYAQTVQKLSSGSQIEQMLAWALGPDPVSRELARFARLPG